MTSNLKKPSIRRRCDNCAVDYNDDNTNCKRCHRNSLSSDNWRPTLDLCKEIVVHYMKQRSHITAKEIADLTEIPEQIVEAAIAKLVKENVIQIQKTMVIIEE